LKREAETSGPGQDLTEAVAAALERAPGRVLAVLDGESFDPDDVCSLNTIEDSLGSAQMYVRNQAYYSFVAEEGSLSFVARLAKSFPRSGRFGDFDVRRVTFSLESSPDSDRQLVLRQTPLVMETDIDEREHPLVLAKHVKAFEFQFWDTRLNDWLDEWKQTNQLPKLVMVTLKTADSAHSVEAQEQITRIISLPAIAVPPNFQLPNQPRGPAQPPPPPGVNPPGQNPPGVNPAPGQKLTPQ